jgi:ABC-type phosphate transport system substrate-binding protein
MSCRLIRRLVVVACCVTSCFAHHMAVVVNKGNNTGNISSAHLARIFRADVVKWSDGKDVILVFHKDSEGEKITLERLNKMSARELQGFIAAHKDSIRVVDSDGDVLNLAESTPGAVGLVDVRSVDSRIKVVKVNGKFPLEVGYLPH